MAAAGAAIAAQPLLAGTAEAACQTCGPSARCHQCTGTVGRCAPGYAYTGYTWTCCQNRRTVLWCWDCTRQGRMCHCARSSSTAC
jgi:hypothetical protein